MKKVILSIVGASLLSTAAFAADTDANNMQGAAPIQPIVVDQGFFATAAIGGGGSTFSGTLNDANGSPLRTSGGGFTWLAGGGYQFNRYIAGEVDYMWLPTVGLTAANGLNTDLQTSLLDFVAKGSYPFTSKFSVFGKVGFGISFSSLTKGGVFVTANNHDFVGVFGGGAEYRVTPNIGLDGQFIYTTGRKNDYVPESFDGLAGVSYYFF